MCEMSQLILGGMAKGHELIEQLLHSTIGSRILSLPLYYNIYIYTLDIIIMLNDSITYA